MQYTGDSYSIVYFRLATGLPTSSALSDSLAGFQSLHFGNLLTPLRVYGQKLFIVSYPISDRKTGPFVLSLSGARNGLDYLILGGFFNPPNHFITLPWICGYKFRHTNILAFWSIFTTSLEPILSKISDQRKPPRRRSLTLAAKQNTLYNF